MDVFKHEYMSVCVAAVHGQTAGLGPLYAAQTALKKSSSLEA